MKVSVKAYAFLKEYLPDGGQTTLEVPPGATIGDLSAMLGLPAERIHVIFRNNRHAEREDPLQDGDHVAFFPPVAGG